MKAEQALKSISVLRTFVRPKLELLPLDGNGYRCWPTRLNTSVVTIAFPAILIVE